MVKDRETLNSLHTYSINLEKTGEKIDKLFKDNGFKIDDFVEYMGFTGNRGIRKWVDGESVPQYANLFALIKFFDVSFEDVLVFNDLDKEGR